MVPGGAVREAAEWRRQELVRAHERATVDLSLAHAWQWGHFTTPASDLAMATKAVEQGFAPALRMFEKYRIDAAALAQAFGVPEDEVRAVWSGPAHAPLVLIDGEDAQALSDEVVARGRENAIRIFRDARWSGSLRYWRPSGLELSYSTGDLFEVLLRAGEGRDPASYPIDGVMWPKAERADELAWLCGVLDEVERRLGLAPGHLRVQFLVESGRSVLELPSLVQAVGARLSGIVFGIADHAADLGLPEIRNDHPASDFARLAIVHAAAAAGVPAIDAMTLEYPVADKALDEAANRTRILDRLATCFRDARHGLALGMAGKWVGHPAQLFACLVAYRSALPKARIDEEVRRIEAYQQAVAAEKGATMIGGLMTDRANDRHSRALLRRAVASGRLSSVKAVSLGVISEAERQAFDAR